jgi:hypothetical protein
MSIEEKKSGLPSGILSEALILALASASAYYFAFTYEKSFLSFFGAPSQFASIDITTLLNFGAIFIGFLVIAFPFLNLFIMILSKSNNPYLIRLIRPYWIFLLVIISHFYFFRLEKLGYLLIYLFSCAFFAFFDFIFPLITQRKNKTYQNKLKDQAEIDSKIGSIPQILGLKFGRESLLFIAILLIGNLLSTQAGLAEAMHKNEFLITNTEPQFIVLRIYTNRLVCAEYDEKMNEVLRQYRVFDLTSNPPELFSRQIIPKVQPLILSSPSPISTIVPIP